MIAVAVAATIGLTSAGSLGRTVRRGGQLHPVEFAQPLGQPRPRDK